MTNIFWIFQLHFCLILSLAFIVGDNETEFLDIPLPDQPPKNSCTVEPKSNKFTPIREWDRGKSIFFRIYLLLSVLFDSIWKVIKFVKHFSFQFYMINGLQSSVMNVMKNLHRLQATSDN